MKKIIATMFFILAACLVIFWAAYGRVKEQKKLPQVNNFEECAKAGYAVMESYPRQCRDAKGQLFFETVIEQPKNVK
jgi:hypothetical protein